MTRKPGRCSKRTGGPWLRLLLLRFVENPCLATPTDIERAAWITVPDVPVLFWCFRVMVRLGVALILLFATAFWYAARHSFEWHRTFLRLALLSLPLPWIAAELGWIVADTAASRGRSKVFSHISRRVDGIGAQRHVVADRLCAVL